MESKFKDIVNKLYASLDLKRRAIGIKLIKSTDEYDKWEVDSTKNKINYCGMVKAASMGHSFKGKYGDFRCASGPRVLGIDKSDPLNSEGENWARLGIYKDKEVSKEIRENLKYNDEEIYGVVVQPLEKYEDYPDVILIVTNPYNSMRIVQGYSHHYGMPKDINLIGNQAICLEGTVVPYKTQSLNISLMCIGTRHRFGWLDEEMIVGIPGNKMEKTVEGIVSTINIMENDKNKKRIEKNFSDNNIDKIDIDYGYNYYKDC